MPKGRPTDSARTEFGERIFQLRKSRGFTQIYVAEKIGVSSRAYAFWERKPVALHTEKIAALAKVFGVSADYIVGIPETEKLKRNGPKGKIEQIFESVNDLPRAKQQHIAGVVEVLNAKPSPYFPHIFNRIITDCSMSRSQL